jgi:hypothetical protein
MWYPISALSAQLSAEDPLTSPGQHTETWDQFIPQPHLQDVTWIERGQTPLATVNVHFKIIIRHHVYLQCLRARHQYGYTR